MAGATVVVVALAALLTSCSSTTTSSETSAEQPAGARPNFKGPFASELQQTWEQTDDVFIRGVIKDQEITDQEWAETVTRLKKCFESKGMSITEYNADGSYAFNPGTNDTESGDKYATGCEESSGIAPLGHLRISMQANPANRNMDEIMYECLVRVRAVPQSYTLEDYRRDNSTYSFPFITEADGKYYDICAAAPLTAQRDE